MPKIASVVEGHGDGPAVRVLLRRLCSEIAPNLIVEVLRPIRAPRSSLLSRGGELERAVELAALNARPDGAVLVLIDADDDCPADLAPQLLDRANRSSIGLPVAVVFAQREFEAWFLAAAESLRGKRRLPDNLRSPANPEEIRDAKGWLKNYMGRYSETIDQPALAADFDLKAARSAASFDKLFREVSGFMAKFQAIDPGARAW